MSNTPTYQQGVRAGLAAAALALSGVAFLNLLGLEKSLLAAVLAVLALRGDIAPPHAVRRGRVALGLAALHVVTFAALIVLFHDRLAHLIDALEKLS